GGQVAQVAAEPELRRGGHAVDRLRALLAEVDLVEVGLQDRALVVARFDEQRVQHFVELAAEGLFLADAEQAAARELLRDRARALARFARTQVHPRRPRDAGQVDAVVVVEVAVFDGLQAGDQQLGHFLDADQATLFLLLAVEGGDARRVQARGLDALLAGRVAQAGHARAGQHHFHATRRDPAVDVEIAAAGDQPTPAVARIGAGAHAGAVVAIARRVELGLERLRIHRQAGAKHQRAPIHARGHLPAQLAEALADLVVQVQGVGNEEAEAEPDRGQAPRQQAPSPVRAGRTVVRATVVVFVVFDARRLGHGSGCDNKGASLAQGRRCAGSWYPFPHCFQSAGVVLACR